MSKSKNRKRNQKVEALIVPNAGAPRNPYARHPLLKKGGVHQKSKKSLRANARRETKQLARDWDSHTLLHLIQR